MNITSHQQFLLQDYEYRDEILNSIGNLLNFYTEKHSKALVVRFDIHYPQGYTEACRNADISKCMAYVIKKYKRQGLDPFYMWVREKDRSPHPHYHCVMFLDAQKVRSFMHVFETVEQAWGRTLNHPVSGCVHDCMDGEHDCNGKIIRRDAGQDIFHARCQEVFDQLSYPANAYSKAPDNDGIRNFATSRISRLNLF